MSSARCASQKCDRILRESRLRFSAHKRGAGQIKNGIRRAGFWRALALGLALILLVLSGQSARAQFYVNSPEVDKGETKIEEHGALYAGPGEDERLRQSHWVEVKHGFTDRLEVIVEGAFRQAIDQSLKARFLELGAQYEIVERHGDGVGFAFRAFYEFALQDHLADEILFGPLAKWVRSGDSATINTFFVGQVGRYADIDSLALKVNWRLKHELSETWALGVEGYNWIDDLAHAGAFDDQKHRIGPVAYFETGGRDGRPEWEFAAGVLFGASEATSDLTYKFDAEIKF